MRQTLIRATLFTAVVALVSSSTCFAQNHSSDPLIVLRKKCIDRLAVAPSATVLDADSRVYPLEPGAAAGDVPDLHHFLGLEPEKQVAEWNPRPEGYAQGRYLLTAFGKTAYMDRYPKSAAWFRAHLAETCSQNETGKLAVVPETAWYYPVQISLRRQLRVLESQEPRKTAALTINTICTLDWGAEHDLYHNGVFSKSIQVAYQPEHIGNTTVLTLTEVRRQITREWDQNADQCMAELLTKRFSHR